MLKTPSEKVGFFAFREKGGKPELLPGGRLDLLISRNRRRYEEASASFDINSELMYNALTLNWGVNMTKKQWLKKGMGFEEIRIKSEIVEGLSVSLNWDCFEGNEGEYDESDPNDEPLLRFDIDKEGEEVQDGSYCTQLTAFDDRKLLIRAARAILSEAEDRWNSGFKRAMEQMSWIGTKNGRLV
jgi:hypothetical protein